MIGLVAARSLSATYGAGVGDQAENFRLYQRNKVPTISVISDLSNENE